jgi:hypothetical protein
MSSARWSIRSPTQRRREAELGSLLDALREDMAEWVTAALGLDPLLTAATLLDALGSGAILCQLAKRIDPAVRMRIHAAAERGSFLARDHIASFIDWMRRRSFPPACLFETEDVVDYRRRMVGTKNVLLALVRASIAGIGLVMLWMLMLML